MDRSIFFSQEQFRGFDVVNDDRYAMVATAQMMLDILGSNGTVLGGFAATQTSPTSLNVNLAAGRIYELADIDATAVGLIPQNTNQILQQGYALAQLIALSTSGIASGHSRWSLIEAQYSQVDSVAPNDPNGGNLPFYNAANPAMPLYNSENTLRAGVAVIQVITGASATTGSEVPPSPTSGWVPLYLIDLTFGQTVITNGEILVAGPSVGTGVPSNYPAAPFLAGLLNSHHDGAAGQAPQIKLTSEVQGILPLGNLPSSSQRSGGGIATFYAFAGNPNGSVAGTAGVAGTSPPDICEDTTTGLLWVCVSTGSTSTAVWRALGTQNTQVVFGTGGATGNWVVPAGVTTIRVRLSGGGGAGAASTSSDSGGGGGAGGYAEGFFAVTPGASLAYAVGAGGAGGAGNGGTGGTTSFGGLLSATGGVGGVTGATPAGGNPGIGSGGAINLNGGYGNDGGATANVPSGIGGASYFGGGSRSADLTPISALAPGSGGAGPFGGSASNGSNGAPGIIIIEY